MIRTVLLAALCAVLFASNADARPKHHHHKSSMNGQFANLRKLASSGFGCSDPIMRPFSCEVAQSRNTAHRKRYRRTPPGLRRVMAEGAGRVIGGRPAGCPRAFCGCGASLHIFGKIVPALNLAANWLRFPRAEPAPGMVAVRRHHVFVLVRHIRGPWWIAHDSNSGRHLTRVHPRSIAGWAIVDPRGV